jgi:hypothetical protein
LFVATRRSFSAFFVGLLDASLAFASTRRASWTPISDAIKAIASVSASRAVSIVPMSSTPLVASVVARRIAFGTTLIQLPFLLVQPASFVNSLMASFPPKRSYFLKSAQICAE